jgi:CBS domain-containing protein
MTFLTNSIMSAGLISISEDRDLKTAESLMKINKIRHLPVVNEENELSGILSSKDLAKAHNKDVAIKTVMTSPVRVVKKNANIKVVIELMLKHKICSVLVSNEEDIVGIVTTDDLLKLLAKVIDDGEDFDSVNVGSFFDETWTSRFQ